MQSALRQPKPWLEAFWQRAYRENVTGLSAMVAYNLMLAVFPFALLVLFVFGQVLKIKGVETGVLDDLQRLFPNAARGCCLVVELQLPKLMVRVRFPSPAPTIRPRSGMLSRPGP